MKFFLALATVCLLSSCSTNTPDPVAKSSELTEWEAVYGQPCPEVLETAVVPPDLSFVGDPSALPYPDTSWVCAYSSQTQGWALQGAPVHVKPLETEQLAAKIRAVKPYTSSRICDKSLGTRYLVVFEASGNLSAVSVDDFGCRSVLFSSNPHTIPMGEPVDGSPVGQFVASGKLLSLVKSFN